MWAHARFVSWGALATQINKNGTPVFLPRSKVETFVINKSTLNMPDQTDKFGSTYLVVTRNVFRTSTSQL